MDDLILQDHANRDIIALLAASKIPTVEKKLWYIVLPYITSEEKSQLKDNLQKEIEHEIKVEEEAVFQFVKMIEDYR